MVVCGQMGLFGAMPQSQLYEMYAITAFLTVMAYWKHRQNIVRLIHGNERKTYLFKKRNQKSRQKSQGGQISYGKSMYIGWWKLGHRPVSGIT